MTATTTQDSQSRMCRPLTKYLNRMSSPNRSASKRDVLAGKVSEDRRAAKGFRWDEAEGARRREWRLKAKHAPCS